MSRGPLNISTNRFPCERQKRFVSKTEAQRKAQATGSVVRRCPRCTTDTVEVFHLTKSPRYAKQDISLRGLS